MFVRIDRSRFLKGTTAAAGSVVAIAAPARAAQFQYKLGAVDEPSTAAAVRMVQFCAAVKRETNGRMEIQPFLQSVLGSQSAMLAQLREDAIQFLVTLDVAYSAVVPSTEIMGIGFAFTSEQQPYAALDGALGAYIRKEFSAKGIHCFEKISGNGFRQVTSSTKPIRTADDFAGFRIRTPASKFIVDLFKTLGASPVPLDPNVMYVALQTHLVDGQEAPFLYIESTRVFEVVKYISVTNHIWGGYWWTANMEAWNALPPDVQGVVQRNVTKYGVLARRDSRLQNVAMADKLRRQGLIINAADTASMRGRLGPYYARWKGDFGSTLWSLLEATTGKLG
jgi:TRAP-type transport system periplasmic protein